MLYLDVQNQLKVRQRMKDTDEGIVPKWTVGQQMSMGTVRAAGFALCTLA